MILVLFLYIRCKNVRVWAYWIYSFDIDLNYLMNKFKVTDSKFLLNT